MLAKTTPVVASDVVVPVVSAAASAACKLVRAEERNVAAVSVDDVKAFKNACSERTMFHFRLPVSSWT